MVFATLYEQHVVVTCAAMAISAGIGMVVWIGLVGYLWAVGRLSTAIDVLFSQLMHDQSPAANLWTALHWEHLYPDCMTWVGLPLLLVLLSAVGGRMPAAANRRPDHPWRAWTCWAIGTWLTVALPGRFFHHYYQCWLPPMCVASGWAASRLLGGGWGIVPVTRAVAVATILLILAGRELLPFYAYPPTPGRGSSIGTRTSWRRRTSRAG